VDGDISVVSYWEKPSPLLPAVAAFCWAKSRAPAVFSCGVSAPIISIRWFPHECRAEAVRQRIIADQVRSSDPVVPIANDAGRAMPCAALAPLTRAELETEMLQRYFDVIDWSED
jgi:hypothetical protein